MGLILCSTRSTSSSNRLILSSSGGGHSSTAGWAVMTAVGFPGGSAVENPSATAGDLASIPGLGRSPGEGNGNLLQYSCLENPMDRGAWQAIVQRVTKSQT